MRTSLIWLAITFALFALSRIMGLLAVLAAATAITAAAAVIFRKRGRHRPDNGGRKDKKRLPFK
ncbi:MAG: hypothetical protein Q3966_03815 [Neisseria sp.]|nr:hypothetical protein [Neisseria sp.]